MARIKDDVTQVGEHRIEFNGPQQRAAGIMSGNEIRDAFGLPALEPVEQETPLLSARYVDVTWRQIVLLVAVCAAVGWMIGWFVVPR